MKKSSLLPILLLILAACVPPAPGALQPNGPSVPPLIVSSTAEPTTKSSPEMTVGDLPVAVEYDLGETTIVQQRFPEDSRFRNMPVRLNGVIAVPTHGAGPSPVVVILHGTHPGCPEVEHGVDRWPCDPADERPNYQGFGYLAETLAANGYVALSLNINAENTFGFGEPTPGERLNQIVDKHLRALATASAGGKNAFGVDLAGKADMRRLALLGHSRGGDMALLFNNSPEMAAATADPDGYGPVAGVLQIAPSPGFFDPADGSPIPLGIILPMCDGDVTNLDGQVFFEAARLASGQEELITSAFVERANHNFFNATLGDDPFGRPGRTDCDPLLEPETQQEFLGDYAVDFFVTLFGNSSEVAAAKERMGMNPALPAPSELYGLAARVAVLPEASERTSIFTPASDVELTTNRLGGAVLAEGVTIFFCEAGSFTPFTRPDLEPCRRSNIVIPGNPALAIVGWGMPGAALRFEIPPGLGDLTQAAAITVRAAPDPLSKLNVEGESQAFSIRLTDGTGKSAIAPTRPDEPALRFPRGEVVNDDSFGDMFTGRLPLTAVRVPLSALHGVDRADIREIALVFDQTPSGSLFLADLTWERLPQVRSQPR